MKTSRGLFFIGILTVLFTLGSCDKLSDLLKVDVVISLPVDMEIPVTPSGDMIYIDEWTMNIDLNDAILKVNNQLGSENIKSVNIQSAYLSISEDNRDDSNNLINISNPIIYFRSDAVREWTNIASWTGVSESEYLQNLNVNTSRDWVNYFQSTSRFSLKFQCRADQPVSRSFRVTGEIKFVLKVSA